MVGCSVRGEPFQLPVAGDVALAPVADLSADIFQGEGHQEAIMESASKKSRTSMAQRSQDSFETPQKTVQRVDMQTKVVNLDLQDEMPEDDGGMCLAPPPV